MITFFIANLRLKFCQDASHLNLTYMYIRMILRENLFAEVNVDFYMIKAAQEKTWITRKQFFWTPHPFFFLFQIFLLLFFDIHFNDIVVLFPKHTIYT